MNSPDISKLIELVCAAKRVYIIGNGGSYANASHVANDLLACGIRAYTLDPSFLTATANDFSYDEAFSRWIETVGEDGDLLIALSGSGTSKNITLAIQTAQECGLDTLLITDYLRTRDMQQSEEDQIALGHDIMRSLKCKS